MLKRTLLSSIITFVCCSVSANDELTDLMSMSLEELSMLDVTMETASKFSQKLTDIPAAVYVLEGERIKRSGAKSIAEALALVPGLNVTKFSNSEYFVSARGFHDGLYNKMLVLMDGRSLFSPVYGGVYWTDIDYVLEDIERIEVLRGPGGAMWGGNAVNGVINIITKSTRDTLGTYATISYEKYGDYSAAVRHGLQFNDSVSGRAFYKQTRRHSYPDYEMQIRRQETAGITFEGDDSTLPWTFRLGGERSSFEQSMWIELYDSNGDWYDYYSKESTVESDSYYAQLEISQIYKDDLVIDYGLWFETNNDQALDAPGTYRTLDTEVSAHYEYSSDSSWTAGIGYRLIEIDFPYQIDNVNLNEIEYFIRVADTDREIDSIANIFVQNDYWWSSDLKSVIGAKVEYFESTDSFEFSPQARALYSLDSQQSVWLGVGRSAVSPSYMDQNTTYLTNGWINFGSETAPDYRYQLIGYGYGKNMSVERVSTLDIGYRYQQTAFEVDVTLFSSLHENVRGYGKYLYSTEYPQLYINEQNDDYEVRTRGLEGASLYRFSDSLKFYATYTYLTAEQSYVGIDDDNNGTEQENNIDYQHLFSLQSMWQINEQWQLDLLLKGQKLKYSDEYEASIDSEFLPNYVALDVRLAWQMANNYPLIELIVQNVGEKEGYYSDSSQATLTGYINEQSIYARLSHEF